MFYDANGNPPSGGDLGQGTINLPSSGGIFYDGVRQIAPHPFDDSQIAPIVVEAMKKITNDYDLKINELLKENASLKSELLKYDTRLKTIEKVVETDSKNSVK